MTVLAASKNLTHRNSFQAHPVVASDIIYRGALVKINAAGNLAPCAAEAGAKFAGVAYEEVDNSAGAAGAKKCKVLDDGVFYDLVCSGMALTDVGSPVYASDDATITTTYAANLQLVGHIVEYVSSTQVGVKLIVDVGPGVAAIADLAAPSATYVEAEQVAQTDKINLMLAAMRAHKIVQG